MVYKWVYNQLLDVWNNIFIYIYIFIHIWIYMHIYIYIYMYRYNTSIATDPVANANVFWVVEYHGD